MDPGRKVEKALTIYTLELSLMDSMHMYNRVIVLAMLTRLLLIAVVENGRSRTPSFLPSFRLVRSAEVPNARRKSRLYLHLSII